MGLFKKAKEAAKSPETTIVGIVTMTVTVLSAFGVFSSEQSDALVIQIPVIAGAIGSLWMVFRAKDVTK